MAAAYAVARRAIAPGTCTAARAVEVTQCMSVMHTCASLHPTASAAVCLPRVATHGLPRAAAPRWIPTRGLHGRPFQPDDLTRYDKGKESIPVPGTIYTIEAERLGVLPAPPAAPLPRRPVPSAAHDFARARAAFHKALSVARAGYLQEVKDSNAAVAAAEDAFRAGVLLRKTDVSAMRAVSKQSRAAARAVVQKRLEEQRKQRVEVSKRKIEAANAAVAARRAAWLAALEADAAKWITEERIDEMITPELFSMKYQPALEPWFARRDAKRRAIEVQRRGLKPGQHMREVLSSDDEFASDWESDGDEAALGARIATERAARDATGVEAAALATARASGGFNEPDYDEAGEKMNKFRATAAALARTGIQVEELFHGKTLAALNEEREAWMQSYARDALRRMKLSEEEQGGFPTGSNGSLVLDDGERDAENAYISYCMSRGASHTAALYYALTRKRERLAAAGHTSGLRAFADAWGKWIDTVEARGAPPPPVMPPPGDVEDVKMTSPEADADAVSQSELVVSGSGASMPEDGGDAGSKEQVDQRLSALMAALGKDAASSGAQAAPPASSAPARAGSALVDAEEPAGSSLKRE